MQLVLRVDISDLIQWRLRSADLTKLPYVHERRRKAFVTYRIAVGPAGE
jgi:hypothetical protein